MPTFSLGGTHDDHKMYSHRKMHSFYRNTYEVYNAPKIIYWKTKDVKKSFLKTYLF